MLNDVLFMVKIVYLTLKKPSGCLLNLCLNLILVTIFKSIKKNQSYPSGGSFWNEGKLIPNKAFSNLE